MTGKRWLLPDERIRRHELLKHFHNKLIDLYTNEHKSASDSTTYFIYVNAFLIGTYIALFYQNGGINNMVQNGDNFVISTSSGPISFSIPSIMSLTLILVFINIIGLGFCIFQFVNMRQIIYRYDFWKEQLMKVENEPEFLGILEVQMVNSDINDYLKFYNELESKKLPPSTEKRSISDYFKFLNGITNYNKHLANIGHDLSTYFTVPIVIALLWLVLLWDLIPTFIQVNWVVFQPTTSSGCCFIVIVIIITVLYICFKGRKIKLFKKR